MADTLSHRDLSLLYHSGELEPAERERFQEHLASCAECRRLLEETTFWESCAREAAENPSAGILDAVNRGTRPVEAPDRIWAGWARACGLGLGLAFAAGLLLLRVAHAPARTDSMTDIDADLSEMNRRIEHLDESLSRGTWNAEFEEGLEDLNRRKGELERQFGKTSGGTS